MLGWLARLPFQSYAYGALTRCLADKGALVALNRTAGEHPAGPCVPNATDDVAVAPEPLPALGGISTYPCVR